MTKKPNRRRTFVKREPKEFDEQVIQIDRVTRVVKGGRKLRFRATVAIGNRKGKVGIGIGKSQEVTGAIQKAIAKAKKELLKVNLDESTIPHQIKIKFKAAKILLLPAVPGTGLIAGGTIRKVLELAGIKDILSKSYGTTNKVNCTKATFEALKRLVPNPKMLKKAKEKAKEKTKPEAKAKPEAKTKADPKAKPSTEAKAKAPAPKAEKDPKAAPTKEPQPTN